MSLSVCFTETFVSQVCERKDLTGLGLGFPKSKVRTIDPQTSSIHVEHQPGQRSGCQPGSLLRRLVSEVRFWPLPNHLRPGVQSLSPPGTRDSDSLAGRLLFPRSLSDTERSQPESTKASTSSSLHCWLPFFSDPSLPGTSRTPSGQMGLSRSSPTAVASWRFLPV